MAELPLIRLHIRRFLFGDTQLKMINYAPLLLLLRMAAVCMRDELGISPTAAGKDALGRARHLLPGSSPAIGRTRLSCWRISSWCPESDV